jgi:hypothetical protein
LILTAGAAVVAVAVTSGQALATVIPDLPGYTDEYEIISPAGEQDGADVPLGWSFQNSNDQGGASSMGSGGADPSLTSIAAIADGACGDDCSETSPVGAYASSQLDYYFEIFGPLASDSVSVTILGSISGGTSFTLPDGSYATTFAGVTVSYGSPAVDPIVFDDETDDGNTGGLINSDLLLSTGIVYEVAAAADASVGEGPGEEAQLAQAVVDPTFTVNTPGYSIQFSPGVISTIPEPSSRLLLLSAIIGLVAACRYCRDKQRHHRHRALAGLVDHDDDGGF